MFRRRRDRNGEPAQKRRGEVAVTLDLGRRSGGRNPPRASCREREGERDRLRRWPRHCCRVRQKSGCRFEQRGEPTEVRIRDGRRCAASREESDFGAVTWANQRCRRHHECGRWNVVQDRSALSLGRLGRGQAQGQSSQIQRRDWRWRPERELQTTIDWRRTSVECVSPVMRISSVSDSRESISCRRQRAPAHSDICLGSRGAPAVCLSRAIGSSASLGGSD